MEDLFILGSVTVRLRVLCGLSSRQLVYIGHVVSLAPVHRAARFVFLLQDGDLTAKLYPEMKHWMILWGSTDSAPAPLLSELAADTAPAPANC